MRNVIDRKRANLVYAADPALDLRVEDLERLRGSENILRVLQLPSAD
jgi:hypothetical protein